MRIGIVAPSSRMDETVAERVTALAERLCPAVELLFHPQCFLSHNHFAGTDRARAEAFVEVANDPSIDAVWFARGGYGACRIAEDAIAALDAAARSKTYLGYSDAGYLLAGLYREAIGTVAHGPMPQDVLREGGEAAVARALAWLASRSAEALEPGLDGTAPVAAFNLIVLGQLLGTPLEPDLEGHVLLLEEVSEHLYRIDRTMFHVTGNAAIRKVKGIRLGSVTHVPCNDPEFGEDEESIFRFWCARADIPYLGRAAIGHDTANRVVPFG